MTLIDGGNAFTDYSVPTPIPFEPIGELSSFQGYYNGLTWGPGTDVQLVEIEGLRGLPGVRGGNVSKPRDHGSYPGRDFLGERVVVVSLQVFAASAPTESVLAGIANAFQLISDPDNQLPLQVLLPGWSSPRLLFCRPTAGGYPIDSDYQFGNVMVPVQLTAADPLLYSSVLHSQSAGLPSPSSGATFDLSFDVEFGQSTGGNLSATNSGNFPTPPVIVVHGPMLNPRITLTETGQFAAFNIQLGADDTLIIDMGAKLVTFNGQYRGNTIVTGSSWWELPPGTSSIGVASSDSAQVTGTFDVTWRDAWGWA